MSDKVEPAADPGADPVLVKQLVLKACNDYIARAAEYEARGGTREAMRLRAVANLLGVIYQGQEGIVSLPKPKGKGPIPPDPIEKALAELVAWNGEEDHLATCQRLEKAERLLKRQNPDLLKAEKEAAKKANPVD